jgi:hypothetical protein
VKSRFGGKVKLPLNPNQPWSAYELGVHNLESALAILHPWILHLEKEEK